MIAVRITRNSFDTMSALVVRDAGMASALTPLLEPLPDQVNSIKRWMVVEAAFTHGTLTELDRLSSNHPAVAASEGDPVSEGSYLYEWLQRHRLGWQPERTVQAMDAQWLRSLEDLNDGLVAAINARSHGAG